MKKAHKVLYKFVAVFALLVLTLWGCNDEMNKTGIDLLLPGDLVSARKITIAKDSIIAYTVKDEMIKTSNPTLSLLGTYNDPIFGKTTADFAYQFRLANYHDVTHAEPDSLVLTLLYKEVYGDTLTQQNLKVYELNTALNPTATDDQSTDLKGMSNSEVLAEKSFVPKFMLDSITRAYGSTNKIPKDTVLQQIKFRLSDPMLKRLIAFKAPPADTLKKYGNNVNDVFLPYFKGLYVEAGDLNQGGSIMKIFPQLVLDTGKVSVVFNTELKLYCHTWNSTKDTMKRDSMTYYVNSNSARVSRFEHYNYSSANFSTQLTKKQGDQPDSLIYLQTTGGLSNKIYIPSLNNWKDSAGCAINKAELIFTVDESTIDTMLTPAPQKLILSLIDSKGHISETNATTKQPALIFPQDLYLSELYFGGTYIKPDKKKKSTGTYTFNLAKHLQDIIKKTKDKDLNYGFYLSTDDKNAIFRRLVLKGTTSKVGIQFNITYTKVNN